MKLWNSAGEPEISVLSFITAITHPEAIVRRFHKHPGGFIKPKACIEKQAQDKKVEELTEAIEEAGQGTKTKLERGRV